MKKKKKGNIIRAFTLLSIYINKCVLSLRTQILRVKIQKYYNFF